MKLTEVRARVVQWEGDTVAGFFPTVDGEIGNELFWYIFDGEPIPLHGHTGPDDSVPGLGLTVNEESLKRFRIIE